MQEPKIISNSPGENPQADFVDIFPHTREDELEEELADARLLHRLSIELIQEDDTAGLYKKIVEAAVAIMGSQYGSMQMLYPDPGSTGKLKLLASSGFDAEAEKFWEWVYRYTGSSCGAALRAGKRVVITDFATCDFMQDAPTLPIFLDAGIYAAQSTPLYSRSGKLLGMISTHWSYQHNPPEQRLHLLDILARQTADLIERTQNVEALRESEARLRALTMATNDVLYRMSPDWREMYHLDGRNFLKDSGNVMDNWMQTYVHRDDHERLMQAIKKAVEARSVFQLEHRVVKVDGTIGWTSSRAVPIFNRDGAIVEWFGVASDISEKKLLMTQLESRVDERTKALQQSNEDLQQFAHVASHDLKEPVRKIRTYGLRLKDELRDTIGENVSENATRYTDKILESASRMSTMIEGVLSYSSFDVAEKKIETLDLSRILFEIENDLEILIAQKEAIIKYDHVPAFEGIQVLIYQLFYNLINNSLKFTKENQPPVINITSCSVLVNEVASVMIIVADNGIGFDPEHNAAIFETFTRLNSKQKYDGTGLGLSLAKKIVERHNGTIEAAGVLEVGATFTIILPVRQSPHDTPRPVTR